MRKMLKTRSVLAFFFESLLCVACHVILEWDSLLHFLQLLVVMMYPTNLDGDVLKTFESLLCVACGWYVGGGCVGCGAVGGWVVGGLVVGARGVGG